jgi:hypothetical protein
VTHPVRYYTQPRGHSDKHGFAQRTRFLSERVLPHVVEVQAAPQPQTTQESGAEPTVSTDVRASIRRLWG